jgi:hypothetical protein
LLIAVLSSMLGLTSPGRCWFTCYIEWQYICFPASERWDSKPQQPHGYYRALGNTIKLVFCKGRRKLCRLTESFAHKTFVLEAPQLQ